MDVSPFLPEIKYLMSYVKDVNFLGRRGSKRSARAGAGQDRLHLQQSLSHEPQAESG
jgi:hypothetical protein